MGKSRRKPRTTGEMVEADWLGCPDPQQLLTFLGERASERKQNLFACACCRRIWRLLTDPRSQRAVEVMERYADALASEEERDRAGKEAVDVLEVAGGTAKMAADAAAMAFEPSASFRPPRAMLCASWAVAEPGNSKDEARNQAMLVRDIFGNPFRPPRIDRACQTPAVLSLAQAAYEERSLPSGELDPPRLAILADALEEAGCDSAEILTHLRSPGPHVRGCWALDLVLGKE